MRLAQKINSSSLCVNVSFLLLETRLAAPTGIPESWPWPQDSDSCPSTSEMEVVNTDVFFSTDKPFILYKVATSTVRCVVGFILFFVGEL